MADIRCPMKCQAFFLLRGMSLLLAVSLWMGCGQGEYNRRFKESLDEHLSATAAKEAEDAANAKPDSPPPAPPPSSLDDEESTDDDPPPPSEEDAQPPADESSADESAGDEPATDESTTEEGPPAEEETRAES